jgi:hypothetical protein
MCVNRKTFHRDAIISSSLLSSALYEPRYLMMSLDVANIGISVLTQKSMAKWFFGAGRFTRSPSSNRSKLFHSINSLVQRKSFSQIISALSAPTQAYLSAAGLEKVSNSSARGLNRKFFCHSLSGRLSWHPCIFLFQALENRVRQRRTRLDAICYWLKRLQRTLAIVLHSSQRNYRRLLRVLDRFRKDDATSKTTWKSSFGANYRQLLVCHVVLDNFTTRKYNFHVLSRTSQIYASFEKNMRVCMIKIILFCSPCIV